MPKQTIASNLDAALKDCGYFDENATVIMLKLNMKELTEQPSFSYHPTPTPALKTQAIADMKQGMRAIITRKKAEAENLVATFDSALDNL